LSACPKGRAAFRAGRKALEFDERARKVDLVYRNPDDPGLPPSFRLEGMGRKVLMSIGGKQRARELNCDY